MLHFCVVVLCIRISMLYSVGSKKDMGEEWDKSTGPNGYGAIMLE